MTELRSKVVEYIRAVWGDKGKPPSLGEIRRGLGLSNRKFYGLFPGGLEEAYRLAAIPENVIAEMLRTTENALKARQSKALKENELTAKVFEMLEKGRSLANIVIELKADPDVVKRLYEKWVELKRIDVNQPVVLKRLEELSDLLKATFAIGECGLCGRRSLKPKFLDEWICPSCGGVLQWRKEYIRRLRPLSPEDYEMKKTFLSWSYR